MDTNDLHANFEHIFKLLKMHRDEIDELKNAPKFNIINRSGKPMRVIPDPDSLDLIIEEETDGQNNG